MQPGEYPAAFFMSACVLSNKKHGIKIKGLQLIRCAPLNSILYLVAGAGFEPATLKIPLIDHKIQKVSPAPHFLPRFGFNRSSIMCVRGSVSLGCPVDGKSRQYVMIDNPISASSTFDFYSVLARQIRIFRGPRNDCLIPQCRSPRSSAFAISSMKRESLNIIVNWIGFLNSHKKKTIRMSGQS